VIVEDGWATGLLTGGVAVLLTLVTVRAYRRSANAGFLFLLLALVVIPTISGLVDGPLVEWLHDGPRAGARSRGTVTVWFQLLRVLLSAVLISTALLLLARPARAAQRRSG
jgi:hypothetical protein